MPAREEPSGPRGRDLVDAQQFLDLTGRLKSAHQRVDGAGVAPDRKARWQRMLVAISESAQHDLSRAEEALERLVAELDRHLRS